MKAAAYILGLVLGFFGLVFLISAGQGNTLPRLIIGIVLLAAAVAVVFLGRMKTPAPSIVQNIEMSGDVSTQQLKCKSCGATLDSKSVEVKAGAVFVKCPYCGTEYQLEEAPKW